MTCRFAGCTQPVAAEGMSRCEEHRMRWAPGKAAEPAPRQPVARIPEWRRHSLAKDMTRSAA